MSQAMWRGSGRLRRPENALAGDCRAVPRERPPALQSPEKGVARGVAPALPTLTWLCWKRPVLDSPCTGWYNPPKQVFVHSTKGSPLSSPERRPPRARTRGTNRALAPGLAWPGWLNGPMITLVVVVVGSILIIAVLLALRTNRALTTIQQPDPRRNPTAQRSRLSRAARQSSGTAASAAWVGVEQATAATSSIRVLSRS